MLNFGPLTDAEGAQKVAKRLMAQYTQNNATHISENNISMIMHDIYKSIGIDAKLKQEDYKEYFKILDANEDGYVTVNDLEELAIKYLTGGSSS